ncbi:DNA polymerase III subunit epsilon [Mangrovicoccus algicola]|uniref:DNA polymerase III subunit epsilon n=1 Tax=Mangrovicoccus algicola TaxID=2771008 RepID=A0A8J6YV05_9RHOB|nr:DNA polymerase III subunit epsilon [Mangrovicoccus algicola]MBE3638267.1 DNA polymerase III subunit epsilon [Mangrovicoccus algicola]
MREIVLDTETTGFDPDTGDRVVEIGAVELWNHLPTGKTYHQYINPARGMPSEAFGVHGIGPDLLNPPRPAQGKEVTLLDKPLFERIGRDFAAFIGEEARIVAHNAAFDHKFLNFELTRMGLAPIARERVVDSLAIARRRFPGSPASLDALCRRFGIDNGERDLHGALLDSQILAEVYLELVGGRQPGLELAAGRRSGDGGDHGSNWKPAPRPVPLPPRLSDEERAAHAAFVAGLGEEALWRKFGA